VERADLYQADSSERFNSMVVDWLEGKAKVVNHSEPMTFGLLLKPYAAHLDGLRKSGSTYPEKEMLNHLTDLLLGMDLKSELEKRLSSSPGKGGFRSQVTQGIAKNVGENFVNLIVYNMARNLGSTGLCVDKGLPPALKKEMTLSKKMLGSEILVPIEGDLCIFNWKDQTQAIVINAKTRLKEIFHVGTLWKILFDISKDEVLMRRWGFSPPARRLDAVCYCFATADMIPRGGVKTQGPDVDVDDPRNLIKMDASFFDWVFVSKSGIGHTGKGIDGSLERKNFFHELASVYDLIEHWFKVKVF
jgi:hypothetical protein